MKTAQASQCKYAGAACIMGNTRDHSWACRKKLAGWGNPLYDFFVLHIKEFLWKRIVLSLSVPVLPAHPAPRPCMMQGLRR
jgi:hypothetical protein